MSNDFGKFWHSLVIYLDKETGPISFSACQQGSTVNENKLKKKVERRFADFLLASYKYIFIVPSESFSPYGEQLDKENRNRDHMTQIHISSKKKTEAKFTDSTE